jgi:ADP-ribosylation factor-binding protein GGA
MREFAGLVTQSADWHRNNPNRKASDLISFDAFADEDDESPMSGDGGLSLPTGPTASTSTTAMTSSGLPLDLFSAPSPSPSPALAYGGSYPSLSTSNVKQDPMAFFRNTPTIQAQPYSPAQSSNMGSLAGLGGMRSMSLNSPVQQHIQPPLVGYSVTPPQPQANANGKRDGASSAQPAQGQKKDAFADLVDLMG